MQKLAYGALFIGLLVACGGNNNNKVVVVDSGSGGPICSPITQTGCAAGMRCTWVNDTETVGHVDCEAAGTAALGAACMFGSDGPTTGFDDCDAGLICISGKCETICDNNGGGSACSAGFACGIYSGLFEVNGTFEAGACDKTCDALADNGFGSGGSGDVIPPRTGTTCDATQGCYGFPSSTDEPTHFTCSGEVNHDLVNRSQCNMANGCAPDSMSVYLNGCAQGYMAGFDDGMVGSTNVICLAFCAPQDCYMGNCGSDNLASQGKSPHACLPTNARDAQNPDNFKVGSDSNSCIYTWVYEIDGSNTLHTSPTSDTLGFCFDHSHYKVDSDGDGKITNNDMGMPYCDTLPGSGSGAVAGINAADLGCISSATATTLGDLGFQNQMTHKRPLMDLPRFPTTVLAKRSR